MQKLKIHMKCIQIHLVVLYSMLPKWQSGIKINLRQKYIICVIRRDSILDCSLHLIIIIITRECLQPRYLIGDVNDMRLNIYYLRNT